ncbi:hypothetical protein [Streptomyces sp. 8N616]|uniref:hypothetical protein n=1 Tax=Streptomyces sp. 8N616 TaxID=3457414 RepID=UPI003FD00825
MLGTASLSLVALDPATASADTCGYTSTRTRHISPALVTAGYAFDAVHANSEFSTRPTDHDPRITRR